MESAKEEDNKGQSASGGNLLTGQPIGRARSMEDVVVPPGDYPRWNSRRHSDVSNIRQSTLKRSNYSFDDLFNRCQIHTSMMDFVDDSDNWSHASLDSVNTDQNQQHSRMSTLSLASITANSGSRNPTNQVPLVPGKEKDACVVNESVHPLHSNSRRGLSHSMILNWVFSKKYPTIKESSSSELTAATDNNKNSVLSVAPNVVDSANGNTNSMHKFSYRDQNAMAPSNW